MLEEVKKEVRTILVPLMEGIVEDVESLTRQEIALVKSEVKQEVAQIKRVTILMTIGGGLSLIGLLLLFFGAVHLLTLIFPAIALWQGFGLIGASLMIFGLFFLKHTSLANKKPSQMASHATSLFI